MNNTTDVHACLSLLNAQSMRFRWDETNHNKDTFFSKIISKNSSLVHLELIHSQTVIAVDNENETNGMQADGIITCNPNLIPVLTVADCMPIYLWDEVTGCFGVLHSGWKGTGIVTQALSLAEKKYGSKAKDFRVVLGPHIHDCCYSVDSERAGYFSKNFTVDCVKKIDENTFAVSLKKANMFLLEKAGVQLDNIQIVNECTCCTVNNQGMHRYGSFRRQTAHCQKNTPLKEMQKYFTPMAAFILHSSKQDLLLMQDSIQGEKICVLNI